MESILTSIKKLLGIDEMYEQFDMDIIIHINTALSVLCDLGVGPEMGYRIKDKSQTWLDYVPELSDNNLEMIKSFVYLKVRLIFDTPTSSVTVKAIEDSIKEHESRIVMNVEHAQKKEANKNAT